MRIYFDNASTTPIYPEVLDLMVDIMKNDASNPSSIHQNGRMAKAIIENARKIVAGIINASVGEIFFTSSATEANNMVIKNAVQDLGIKRIISSPTEHHCILHSLAYISKTTDCEIIFLKVDGYGQINLEELERILKESDKKTMVSIMHGNNEIGTISPMHEIGALCEKYGALYHSDSVQTIGKYAIDVQANKLSFLSGSAHKFHGPKGVGFVFISNDNIISPYIHGGAQERNMRAGTENVPGIAGLALALDISHKNKEENRLKIEILRTELKNQLIAVFEDITFNGNQDHNYMSHVLSVSFPPTPKAELLVFNLDIAGISASSGSACTAGIEEDSHVLQAISHPRDRKTIRFSFSPNNTLEEVEMLIEKLKTMTPIKALKVI